MRRWLALAAGFGVLVALERVTRTPKGIPGRRKRPMTWVLELGARLLQPKRPLSRFDVYLLGFHPLRDDPHVQMEAHHFCRMVNEDFVQCVIFDGDGPGARLTGVEYMVSERLYERMPDDEKRYWHPHNYEILSGTLIAPGLPPALEKRFLRRMVNSYGKTWHFWRAGLEDGEGVPLPQGDACLAWSFNHDGELDPHLLADRDRRLGVDWRERRRQRASLSRKARPQRGVNLLRHVFGAFGTPDGVVDRSDAELGTELVPDQTVR